MSRLDQNYREMLSQVAGGTSTSGGYMTAGAGSSANIGGYSSKHANDR